MQPLQLYGKIDNVGKMDITNRQRLVEWCVQNSGKNIRIRFDRAGAKRSLPQNSYYWGIVIREITIRLHELGHQGIEDETVHELMKLKFNHELVINDATGEYMELPKTTTDLTKTEFAEYVDRIRQWASEFLSINIPDPQPGDIQ